MRRKAGQYARDTTRRLAWRTVYALLLLVGAGAVGALVLGLGSTEFLVLELGLLAAMVTLDRYATPLIDRWDRGACGEEAVGEVLAELSGDGWQVIHDISTGRGNIDHIAIGPAGLFTIETKSHGGRIAVDRLDERMLRQAYAQRKWLEQVTGKQVEALLVFSRAYLSGPVTRRRGVVVLPARMLAGHLRRRRAVITADDAQLLSERLAAALA